MASKNCRLVFALIFVSALLTVSLARAEIRYTYRDLGTLGGASSCAYDINNKGEVVGWAYRTIEGMVPTYEWDPNNPFHMIITGYSEGMVNVTNAFLYDYRQDEMVGLGEPAERSAAYAINENSTIVGAVGAADNNKKAFIAGRGFLTAFDVATGPINSSIAKDINDQGQIVGNTYTSSGSVWFTTNYDTPDQITTYSELLGSSSHCRAINNQGEIVGDSFLNSNKTGPIHAVLLDGNTAVDLQTLGNGEKSYAFDVNDSGQIVGMSEYQTNYPSSLSHAFLFSDGQMQDIGTLNEGEYSEAAGINNLGQIVGRSGHSAMLYENGQMYDLNELVDVPEGWTLSYANAINDLGQIVGYARETGVSSVQRAFLLTPIEGVMIDAPLINLMRMELSMASNFAVPEPGTGAILFVGLLCFLLTAMRRWRRSCQR